ncbi:MAG: hypothetical protein AAGB34_09250, partial [Planctomycetota bacterium]
MAQPITLTAFAIAGALVVLAAGGTLLSGEDDRSTPSDRLIRAGAAAPSQSGSVNRVRSEGRSLFSSGANGPSANGNSPAMLAPPGSSSAADRTTRRFTENSLVAQAETPNRRTVTSDRTRRVAGTSALERRRRSMQNQNDSNENAQSPARSIESFHQQQREQAQLHPNIRARRDRSQPSPAEQIGLQNGQRDSGSDSEGDSSGSDPVFEQLLQQALENGWISESEANEARQRYQDRQDGSAPPVSVPTDRGPNTPDNGSDNPNPITDPGDRNPIDNPSTDNPSGPSEPSTPTNPIGGGSNGGVIPPITPGDPIDQGEIPDGIDGGSGVDGGDGGGDGGDGGGDPTDDPDEIDTSPETNRIQAMWVRVPLLQFEPLILPSSELLGRVRYELVLRSDQPLEYVLINFGTTAPMLSFVGEQPARNTTSAANLNPQPRAMYPTPDEVNLPNAPSTPATDDFRRLRAAELTDSHFLFGEQPPVGTREFAGAIGPSVVGIVFALNTVQAFGE